MLYHFSEPLLRAYGRVAPTERGTYRLVRAARRLRPRRRWADWFIVSNEIRMRLDLATYPDCCMAFGLYELTTARWIQRLLRPGDRFVDAGANIGYFTLMAARCVGHAGRVDAFEPQPDNHARLRHHVQANAVGSIVTLHAAALSDQPGEIRIHAPLGHHPAFNHGCSSIHAPAGIPVKTTIAPTVRLDDVVIGVAPRLIKMDVEGAESLVVGGMTRLLTGDRPPWIIGELNPPQAAAGGMAADTWVRRVLDARPDYTVHVIGSRLTRVDVAAGGLEGLDQVNLLLQPSEAAEPAQPDMAVAERGDGVPPVPR